MSLNESNVHVRIKGDKKRIEIMGKLVSFDEHLNLMMTDCEEKITEITSKEGKQSIEKIKTVKHSMIFIRGDLVITISPSHSVSK